MDLICSFPTKELSTYELDFVEKYKSQKNVSPS
jgi:hypothetical protein